MTPRDREFVAGLCAARAGLSIDPSRAYPFESALAPAARREGYLSVADLVRAVRERGDERLAWAVVEAMAPARTAFFRDAAVFEAVGDWLKRQAPPRGGRPLRIWSAACGSGQEPYSLAMQVEELSLAAADVEIFASDLGERRLEKAQGGVFSHFEAQCGLSAHRLVRHFENRGDAFALSAALRRRVRWGRINLLDDLGRVGRYDMVLCRHLLADMVPAARRQVLAGLSAAVAPGGRLVLDLRGEAQARALGLEPAPDIPGGYLAAAAVAVAA